MQLLSKAWDPGQVFVLLLSIQHQPVTGHESEADCSSASQKEDLYRRDSEFGEKVQISFPRLLQHCGQLIEIVAKGQEIWVGKKTVRGQTELHEYQ